ncbi:hypothetical protein QBC46DRAFT_398405 [Diplogelasinospora grovesii]|uniref:Uncharacterized protein n=1 Tax=Diplogelasinospora grovesii TaxID=303347 RepID=A0AAN6MXB1_9PEZI|nr:hypothetical protein QBC46DRAFT_398405 [Diplogelasinospora grovesii]
MSKNLLCADYERYDEEDFSVLLFRCGARVVFRFIYGSLPKEYAPLFDTPVRARTASLITDSPPYPHQGRFTSDIPLWCLKSKGQGVPPCWLVMSADLNRSSPSQQSISWARKILPEKNPSHADNSSVSTLLVEAWKTVRYRR